MTWLTVPKPPLALRQFSHTHAVYFPHMARAKVLAIIRICKGLPSKKLRNVKASQGDFAARCKNNILRSLRGLSLASFNASAYIILPINDIRPTILAIFDRPGLLFLSD